jgi:hypothetical protein
MGLTTTNKYQLGRYYKISGSTYLATKSTGVPGKEEVTLEDVFTNKKIIRKQQYIKR